MNKIKDLFTNVDSVLILTHKNPDGDAIGSSLSLYNILLNMNYNVDIHIVDAPSTFSFLPNFDKIKTTPQKLCYDLVITLDTATINRIGEDDRYFENAKYTLNIDHHSSNTNYANFNYILGNSPACCQYLYSIYKDLNLNIDKNIATCLITGILTDTGGFQYSNIDSLTFNIASEFSKIIDISSIYRKVLALKSKIQFEINKIAMDRLEFYNNGKISFTYLSIDDIDKLNGTLNDCEGIVNIGRNIENVEISIFIRIGKNINRVSLRGNGKIDTSSISQLFGGGGHYDASGFETDIEFTLLKKRLLREIIKKFDNNG